MKAAMRSWMIIFLAICAPLLSRVPTGAEAAKPVKRCNGNDDCKLFPCTSSVAVCVSHWCACQVADININDYAAPCRSSTDCRDTAEDCPWGKAACHNGKCMCMHINQNQNDQCRSNRNDCAGTPCRDGTIECIDGRCVCEE